MVNLKKVIKLYYDRFWFWFFLNYPFEFWKHTYRTVQKWLPFTKKEKRKKRIKQKLITEASDAMWQINSSNKVGSIRSVSSEIKGFSAKTTSLAAAGSVDNKRQ